MQGGITISPPGAFMHMAKGANLLSKIREFHLIDLRTIRRHHHGFRRLKRASTDWIKDGESSIFGRGVLIPN